MSESTKAIKLARYVDRLPEGTYVIRLEKNSAGWVVSVHQTVNRRSAWEI